MISPDTREIDAPPPPTSESAWDDHLLRDPHNVADKHGRVRRMFAAIAPSYDLNNRLHSLWLDQYWRRKTVKLAKVTPADSIVDVACGTGDLTLKFAQASCTASNRGQGFGNHLRPPRDHVLGIDFTLEMLPIARQKAATRRAKHAGGHFKLGDFTQFICGDASALPLPDQSADIVSIAFGIRNVADPAAAMREFHRILRPGGRLMILEFSLPGNAILRGLYNFYFRKLLPRTATLISGDKTGAYKYLPESVNTFIGREEMMRMMRAVGFAKVEQFPMTFGVCVCYRGVKS